VLGRCGKEEPAAPVENLSHSTGRQYFPAKFYKAELLPEATATDTLVLLRHTDLEVHGYAVSQNSGGHEKEMKND